MKWDDAAIEANSLLRRRPSVWNTLWLLPVAVALVLCGGWMTQVEDGTARDVWDAERVCGTESGPEPPCARVLSVTGFDYERGGRRSSGQHYVTFRDPRLGERRLPYDLGIVAQQRADFGSGATVWVVDDEVIGLVDGAGKRWVDFGATSQTPFLAVMGGIWAMGMGLVTLAWVPQSWRWDGAPPSTPGLAMLRWLTLVVGLAVLVPSAAGVAQFPLPLVAVLAVGIGAASVWFWTRAWWDLWTGRERDRWLPWGRKPQRPSPR